MRLSLRNVRSFNVPLENECQRWNFTNSTIEGCLAVAAIQAVASFVVVYGMELGATNSQVGMLISLPFLTNALVILAGGRVISGRSNILRPTYTASAMHRVFVVLMLLAPWLPAHLRVWWVLITYSLAASAAVLTSTWWSAMMSELYPREHRGAVFGTRAMFTGSAGVLATLITGKGLDLLPFPYNFTLMFLLAAITGFIAVRFLASTRLPELASTLKSTPSAGVGQRLRWRDVLKGANKRAFVHLALPVFFFNIGFHLAAPVINIYFVEHLHLSKGRIGVLSAVFLVFQVLSSRFWGRMGDRLGNHVVAFISMVILIAQAAFYYLVPSMPYLLLMQTLGGFAFGGYVMSTFNGVIGLGTPAERAVLVSLFNVVACLGGFLSPSAGTMILDRYGLLTAFLVAAILRGFGAILMSIPAKLDWQQGGIAKWLYLRRLHIPLSVGHRRKRVAASIR